MSSKPPQKDHWSHESYKASASFVPQLTTRVLQYLDPQPTDVILDIGCGDGVLTAKIAPLCSRIHGLDASGSFIETAMATVKSQLPNTDFRVADCRRLLPETYPMLIEEKYDKVFSNAAMHWILRDETCRIPFFSDVCALLNSGGTFTFEMGGFENVCEVHVALRAVLRFKYGISAEGLAAVDPWFFPSMEWIRETLEGAGFEVVVVENEHRPTRLTGEKGGGLEGWLRLMCAMFLEVLDEGVREEAVRGLCEVLGPVVTKSDGSQWLNYVRLRAVAKKK